MKAIGMTTTPAIKIRNVKIQDEIKFNLFHNSIETSKSVVKINQDLQLGYNIVKHENIIVGKNENAVIIKAIGDLIYSYGEWGSIICDENGLVLFNSDYAFASKQLKHDVICYVIENKNANEVINYLTDEYGEYNYDALQIKSYNQLYCQMTRMTDKGKNKLSTTYENFVLPRLKKDLRILDFGAGKCHYVKMLRNQGYNIFGYEPFFQGKQNNINITQVIKMIKDIEADVRENGLCDMVILDSVINSVVNNEFEHLVLTSCNAFLKKDGIFITGTRNLKQVENHKNHKKAYAQKRLLEFLDKDNYTATFRSGVWTMQHFHTHDSLRDLLGKYFEKVEIYGANTSPCIYSICYKPINLPINEYERALNIELNMDYPNNYHHNQHKELVGLLINCLESR